MFTIVVYVSIKENVKRVCEINNCDHFLNLLLKNVGYSTMPEIVEWKS